MPLIRKRRAAEEADEVDADAETPTQRRRRSSPEDEDVDYFQAAAEADSSTKQMVKNLVRLALASEYSRTPIRRTEINARVLGTSTRQFKTVFAEAQTQLRVVFGMEMTELPLREKVTLAQRRAAQKAQSSQKSSGAWVLTSILPQRFRTAEVLAPAQIPTAEAEAQYVALYTFIIALILLSGGALPDSRLDRCLKRANVDETTPFADSAAMNGIDKTDKLLRRMEKDGYVVKIRDTSTGEETIDWVVGPRGKVEVGEQGVRGLVASVYGAMDEDDAVELVRRMDRSLGMAEKKSQNAQPEQARERRGRKKNNANNRGEEEEDEDDDGEEGEEGEEEE